MKTSYRAVLSDNSNIYFIAHDDHEAAENSKAFAELTNKTLLDVVVMKDYYPNCWDDIKALPDELLPTMSYSEVLTEWAGAWSLPSGINSIIRAKNQNGQVKEFVYRSGHHAFRRLEQLIKTDHEILVITDQFCHHIDPANYH